MLDAFDSTVFAMVGDLRREGVRSLHMGTSSGLICPGASLMRALCLVLYLRNMVPHARSCAHPERAVGTIRDDAQDFVATGVNESGR